MKKILFIILSILLAIAMIICVKPMVFYANTRQIEMDVSIDDVNLYEISEILPDNINFIDLLCNYNVDPITALGIQKNQGDYVCLIISVTMHNFSNETVFDWIYAFKYKNCYYSYINFKPKPSPSFSTVIESGKSSEDVLKIIVPKIILFNNEEISNAHLKSKVISDFKLTIKAKKFRQEHIYSNVQ